MSDNANVALIVGVTGIQGLSLAKKLLSEKGQQWEVYGISRRAQPYLPEGLKHIPCDLQDRDSCEVQLKSLVNITHVFYVTWQPRATEKENIAINGEMITNLIECLPSKIRHFSLTTGTKNYTGPFESWELDIQRHDTPYKESAPRLSVPNFYYTMEDIVFENAKKSGFSWSVSRPSYIVGFAPNNAMNMAATIAIYASLCQHLGRPFTFPGTQKGYSILMDYSDTDLISEHLLWQATTPAAANQALNIVNGDVCRWRRLWNIIGDYFEFADERPVESIDLTVEMQDMGPVWDAMVKQYGLKKMALDQLATWWFLDGATKLDGELLISDMNKSRELGFLKYQDTEKSFIKVFDYMRENRYIP